MRYVLVPPPAPDQASLDALTTTFPKLVFLLWTGDELDRDLNLTNVEWLLPPVDVARERVERVRFKNALKLVTTLSQVG